MHIDIQGVHKFFLWFSVNLLYGTIETTHTMIHIIGILLKLCVSGWQCLSPAELQIVVNVGLNKLSSLHENLNVSFGSMNLISQLQFKRDLSKNLEDLHLM